jgi:glycosyltransferase involved in cell wall biosynthesis
MTRNLTALIWNAHWQTLGGGEKYALEIGEALREEGFRVYFVGVDTFPGVDFTRVFEITIDESEYLQVSSEGEVLALGKVSDIFINASYGSRLSAPHENSIYICHFPFVTKLQKLLSKLHVKQRAIQTGLENIYANPGGTIQIMSNSTLRLEEDSRVRGSSRVNTWDIIGEDGNVRNIESAEFSVDLDRGLYFLEKKENQSSELTLRDFPQPSLIGILVDYLVRSLKFKDTYKQLWVHSEFVAKWTRQIWQREPFVLYPPVTSGFTSNAQKAPSRIISVGRFMSKKSGHSKNQLEMIKAFAMLTKKSDLPWELHLAGGVSRRQQAYFQRVVKLSKGLNVFLYPNATHKELMSLYSSSSVYWHASGLGQPKSRPDRFEHFGITVVEAMFFGLVPIVFNVGGPAEVLQDYPKLSFSSKSELVDQTIAITEQENVGLRDEMKQIASRYERANFHRKVIENVKKLSRSSALEASD